MASTAGRVADSCTRATACSNQTGRPIRQSPGRPSSRPQLMALSLPSPAFLWAPPTELGCGSAAPHEQPIYPVAHVSKIGLVASLQLGDDTAGITDFDERLSHGSPIDISVAQIHPAISVLVAFEIL